METSDIIKYMYWFSLKEKKDFRRLIVSSYTNLYIGNKGFWVSESEIIKWIKANVEINQDRFYNGYYKNYD